jgi:hypothetical protein
MAYVLAQAGTTLVVVQTDGTVVALTLPTGVVLRTDRRPRMAVLNRNTIIVGSPTRNLWVDENRVVRPATLQPPNTAPTLTATGSGALSGTFRVRVSYLIVDADGNVLVESPLGPISAASPTLSSQILHVAGIPISPDPEVNARRLYRTATGPGEAFFEWVDLDGNTQTSLDDDLVDAGLPSIAAPTDLGSPEGTTASSRLELLVEWGGRLWAKGSTQIDELIFSGDGKFYAWSAANMIPIPPRGRDALGIQALIPRRDELGVARVDSLHKIIGRSEATYQRVKVAEGIGVLAPESVIVWRDIAFFLGQDGVYSWDANSFQSVSDEKVKAWFTTDDYFNRAKFANAWAVLDPIDQTYVLFLTAAGSSTIGDRFVKYNPTHKSWWGPHVTGAFTPASANLCTNANDELVMLIGGTTGYIWKDRGQTFTDGTATAIDLDIDAIFSAETPDIEKYWGQPSFFNKVQAAGTLSVTPKVGALSAVAQSAISVNLTKPRTRARRLGHGRHLQLNLRQNVVAQGAEIYGFEVPYFEIGRRP